MYTNINKQWNKHKNKIHLINQGAYGCFYYPGLGCRGKLVRGAYGIKIHFQDETSENEWDISKRIRQNIRGYAKFFAPILQQCPVESNTYGNALSSCDVYNKYKKRHQELQHHDTSSSTLSSLQKPLFSSKIRYVGKSNIKEYVMRTLNGGGVQGFRRMLQTQRYAFRGLLALQKEKIVHFDIRYNNIM